MKKQFSILLLMIIMPGLANLVQAEDVPPPISGWVKHSGNPVIQPESIPAPEGGIYPVMADPTVLFDEGKFKMWFGYGGLDNAADMSSVRVRVGYAESQDGINWTVVSAPALDTGSGWDRTNAETPSVVMDANAAPGDPRRYRLYYAGLDHELEKQPFEKLVEIGMVYGIGLAFSSDGKNFTRLPAEESPFGAEGLVLKPDTPALDRETCDFINVADPHVLYHNGEYHLWYTSMCIVPAEGRGYFSIAYATSSDGIHWNKEGVVIKPDQPWETARTEAHVGRPYVLWANNRFEMFYDAVKDDDNPMKNTSAGVGFAFSLDGKNWIKHPAPILTGDGSAGESRGMIIGTGVLYKDGKYNLYYPGADPNWDRFTINLANWNS